ncbi:nodal homolog [Mytilus edulis]|uniref:nodal homolog n=1 Tax=Mytilus edulis TaxID=6550 RepID=UPI0039F13247
MRTINIQAANFLSLFIFRSVVCFSDFLDLSKNYRTPSTVLKNNFLSETEAVKLTHITPERSDQVMSAEYMFDLLNKLENGNDVLKASGMLDTSGDLDTADTVRSFSSKLKQFSRMYDVYKFKVHALSVEEHIKRVELRLNQNKESLSRKTKVKYVIKQNGHSILKYHSKENVEVDGKYSVVDLSKTIKSLINQVHGNITIKVSIKKNIKFDPSNKSQKLRREEGETKNDALLIIFSQDKGFLHEMYEKIMKMDPAEQLSRSKRAIQMKERRKNRTKGRKKRKMCQLQDFDVDFNHLGWGQWIVYPKVFNAKICTGVCKSPVAEKFTPTNHAMLQSLMRLGQPKAAPMPCCVPTKLKPLKLLYYEQDEIVVRLHDDMVADSCGCR